MNIDRIAGLRLQNQGVSSVESNWSPSQVVQQLGAVQAQDYMQAMWAIGLRSPGATLSKVEQSIKGREMVLTWTQRGTIHFVPTEDVLWRLSLAAPRLLQQSKRRREQLELDDSTLERSESLIRNMLQGGAQVTRGELLEQLERAGIRTDSQRGYHILWHSAYKGLICFGPISGKQQTFVLLDEWATDAQKLTREDALAKLALRYFNAHGPATVHDFAWWTGMTLADAREGLEAIKGKLDTERMDGSDYWMGKQTDGAWTGQRKEEHSKEEQQQGKASAVYLLPGFDEYILGYKERGAVLKPEIAPRIVPGNNGVFLPMVVVNGQVVGTWKRTVKKKGIDVVIHPFERLDGFEEEIEQRAEACAKFMELPLTKLVFEQAVK
ncbi:Winged helix DNA-binding domain-containing protein [Paenibacillus algorifonticola]|uniref:Winged helix DNA-binding domain-containing protein n=1 Tax=Paenibacillus algorifonticola TaxID=684063 RepID=A0A1I2BXG5_9BACL|nr:winged helix DNA-binding domain-containing protein [Paenibacillus algorifonticola]SFE60801.1 Winged helix DNA-binding domain-containing protein [Paenibacillus algorifonticola]